MRNPEYEFEWLVGVVDAEDTLKPGELGYVHRHILLPLTSADKSKLVRGSGDEYADCTHALICAQTQGTCGDEEQIVISVYVTDSEGNGPDDMPLYEDFNTPWSEVYDRYVHRVNVGTLVND